jgi:hypothetical protein
MSTQRSPTSGAGTSTLAPNAIVSSGSVVPHPIAKIR